MAQVGVQMGFECLHRRRLHSLSGQPVPVLRHPYCIEVLPHVSREHSKFYAIAPCPMATHHREEPGLIHLPPISL